MQHHRLKNDDPHRLRCPRGHAGWKPINGHFWCPACERRFEDGAFARVEDAKTGEMLDRTAVRRLEEQVSDEEVAV